MRARTSPGGIVLSIALALTCADRAVALGDPLVPEFHVTPLATPAGSPWAVPRTVNGAGRAAGDTPTTGVVWDGESLVEIPLLQGSMSVDIRAINLSDQVVGRAVHDGGMTAFYFHEGTIVDLFPQRVAGEHAIAMGINDAGLIVGGATMWESASGSFVEHAVVWQPGTTLATVIESPAVAGGSTAVAVNNVGQVLGQSGDTAFIWQDGVITELGELNMAMLGFNDGGAIAGFKINEEDDHWLAVVFADGSFQVFDTLGGFDAQAWGLNNVGDTVGSAQIPTGHWHATLWTQGGAIDLHERVADQIDGTLTLARAINDTGQIIAQASSAEVFASGWLLTPIALGDLDGDGVVGITDMLLLLTGWGPCGANPCPADLDNDGTVTTSDFLLLLGNWG